MRSHVLEKSPRALPFGPCGAGFDELTVKYPKPENSEFWDFYPDGKITTIFFVVVCKMPLKLYIYFILCMLIYLVFNNLTIIFQVPRLLLGQFPGPPPCIPHHLAQYHSPLLQIQDGSVTIGRDLSSVHISKHLRCSESVWSGCKS